MGLAIGSRKGQRYVIEEGRTWSHPIWSKEELIGDGVSNEEINTGYIRLEEAFRLDIRGYDTRKETLYVKKDEGLIGA